MRKPIPCLAMLVLVAHAGCGDSDPTPELPVATGPPPPPWFERAGADGGISFHHVSGHDGRTFLFPESIGGGGALLDMDGDGDLDAYLVQSGSLKNPGSGSGNRLFRNLGNGQFEDATEGSGTDDRGYGMGVATGDYDQDGDLDLFVSNLGPDTLLRNDGGGIFTDVTENAGLGDPGWGTSAAFFDADRDGDLDLYVARYMHWSLEMEIECLNSRGNPDYCLPTNYNASATDLLYRNEGDGSFTEVSLPAGIMTRTGTGLGVICGDFNADGWLDIFVANDSMPDILWINDGNGHFTDNAMLSGCAVDSAGDVTASMGVTAADIDDDGDLDLLVCNLHSESDSLFRNDGAYFTDITTRVGLGVASRSFTRFGMGFVDFNSDGWLDIYQGNGAIEKAWNPRSDDAYAEPNMLFIGSPELFTRSPLQGGTASPLVATSRGVAFGDVDGDNDVDILVINRDAEAHLLLNTAPGNGRVLRLNLLDEHGSDALNARITLTVGTRRIVREVRTAYSYLTANEPQVHIGLGTATGATGITVTWMDGTSEDFPDFDAPGTYRLMWGEGQ